MKLKLIIALLIAVGISGLLCLRAEDKPKQPDVQWLGNPSYWMDVGEQIQWGGKMVEVNVRPQQMRSPNIEIGLRDDGVVVWRKKQ